MAAIVALCALGVSRAYFALQSWREANFRPESEWRFAARSLSIADSKAQERFKSQLKPSNPMMEINGLKNEIIESWIEKVPMPFEIQGHQLYWDVGYVRFEENRPPFDYRVLVSDGKKGIWVVTRGSVVAFRLEHDTEFPILFRLENRSAIGVVTLLTK